MSEQATVVCLCGSTRFPQAFDLANMHESLMGRVVISVGMCGHADQPTGARFLTSDGDESTKEKRALDQLHFRKIDLADEILVINVGGYVGSSTKREIAYAAGQGKTVRFLFPDESAASLPPGPPARTSYDTPERTSSRAPIQAVPGEPTQGNEWTCPHGVTYSGTGEFISGARNAHAEFEGRIASDDERRSVNDIAQDIVTAAPHVEPLVEEWFEVTTARLNRGAEDAFKGAARDTGGRSG